MNENKINYIIFIYIFICLMLLLYNIIYILLASSRSKRHIMKVGKWNNELTKIILNNEVKKENLEKHNNHLIRKLKKLDELVAFDEAITSFVSNRSADILNDYIDTLAKIFTALAEEYCKRPSMEKGYFAFVVSKLPFDEAKDTVILSQQLLLFFNNSTIFCREKVLLALYKIGREEMVLRAFSLLDEEEMYHPTQLLGDGLLTFTGDREHLAWSIWNKSAGWSDSIQVAIVKFASLVSDAFCEEFLRELKGNQRPYEVKFALIRYFRRWKYTPAKDYFIDFICEDISEDLAIAMTSALSNYPGELTKMALLKALHSSNWYVRKNSAESLISMGITSEYADALRKSGDKYAAEILEYYITNKENEKKE